MKDIKGCLSHNTDHWSTPSNLYKAFMDQGYIDPCPLNADFDGLQRTYKNTKLYVNPPFSKLAEWVDWCIKQYFNGCEIYLLMPSRTDTKYFDRLYALLPHIFFIKGRLHFNDSKKCAPFPTCIIHMYRHTDFWKGRYCICELENFIHWYLLNDYGY